ncbi:head protein [Stigmatella sp. ncwal1]|uniref:Head protein n=1 Tax=Stigmatella ashevillensis TaxID=2995309 RepID=A0ABT5DID3_9BACT|nr:head protein [Stigmatella ashevillena]MDC0712096.1 head protein [Stigmatella ashevillena]
MSTRKLLSAAKALIAELQSSTAHPEQRELLNAVFDALLFIDSTGQIYAFEDYRRHLASDDLPLVVASFDTRQAAETWLQKHPEPPSSALILIADQYHELAFIRELNLRRISPHPVLDEFLRALIRDGLPPAVASFTTRQEAETWFKGQDTLGRQSLIRIAGRPYLAVYQPRIQHRAIYPFPAFPP